MSDPVVGFVAPLGPHGAHSATWPCRECKSRTPTWSGGLCAACRRSPAPPIDLGKAQAAKRSLQRLEHIEAALVTAAVSAAKAREGLTSEQARVYGEAFRAAWKGREDCPHVAGLAAVEAM